MKKLLITGANGFIGSHLVEYMHESGYDVKALCEYNCLGSLGHLQNLACLKDVEVVSGDLRDGHFVKGLVKGCSHVLHLGALIAIPYSYVAPASYVQTNVLGTLNMLQAALDEGVQGFVQTSTSEVYGSAQSLPMSEAHPLNAMSPYAATKIAADALAASFYASYELPVLIARPFNTYGPRQSERAFIPAMIAQLLSDVEVIKVGDLSPTRDLNYVSDTCAGFEALLHLPMRGDTYNIGSGVKTSMKEVLKILFELTGSQARIEADPKRFRPKNSEVLNLQCDASKLKNASSWESRVSLKEGLKACVQWFKEHEKDLRGGYLI